MKTKLIVTSLFLALAFVSCKNGDKTPAEAAETKVETFDVSVDLIIKKADDLILFYKDGSNQWFDDEHSVWLGVKGSGDVQTATFSLPEGVLATDLRLDIGRNDFKGQEPIEIKKIIISYRGKKFEVTEESFANYFTANEFISFDPATKLYSFKKNEKGEYDPFFVAKEPLFGELLKIAK